MDHVSVFSLLVLTLLQQCGAEVTGTWYSANVINNGEYSPKPISEIFSTESSFSPTNPIIVASSSTSPPGVSTTTSNAYSQNPSSYPTLNPTLFSSSFASPDPTLFSSSYGTTEPTLFPSTFSTLPPLTSEDFGISSPVPTQNAIEEKSTTQSTPAQPGPIDRQSPFPFAVLPPSDPKNPSNYFVIYQQAPQSVENYRGPTQPNPSSSIQPELSTLQSLSTLRPEVSTPLTTLSTFRPEVSTLSTFQPNSDSTFPSNLPLNPLFFSTTGVPNKKNAVNCNNTDPKSVQPRIPSLRIRMVAPSGSLTNVYINQPAATTTRKPTTTKRPTTTRTRKTKRSRNSYDGCMNTCDGRKAPICATPLAVTPIDPDKLKGFPSICHMACHNSFRKEQYEMLVDGRCGRLRTRIRTVDSDTKLKRTELNKAQYTVVESNSPTVVQVSSLK